MAFMLVSYTHRGSFAAVGYGDSVDECLAAALADGCPLATVGPRTRGRPRFFAHDRTDWREVEGDEFERLRGLEESRKILRSRKGEIEPPMWRWAA